MALTTLIVRVMFLRVAVSLRGSGIIENSVGNKLSYK